MDIFHDRSAQPMLMSEVGEAFDSPDHVFELKLDGERCLAYLSPDATTLINRRGRSVLSQFPELADLHTAVGRHTCILDGELIVNEGRKLDFEFIKQRSLAKNPLTINRLARQHPALFVALDLLYLDGEETLDWPLTDRQARLRDIARETDHLIHVRQIDAAGLAFFALVREQGLEGIIAKRKDSVYRMGKRTKDWVKIKNWIDDLFIICGYVPSDNAAVVSLVLGQRTDDGAMLYTGRVALGINRPEYALVAALPRRKTHPFEERPPEASMPTVWVRPTLVCRIGFMCWTAHNKLRQPFFMDMLPDTDASSVMATAATKESVRVC